MPIILGSHNHISARISLSLGNNVIYGKVSKHMAKQEHPRESIVDPQGLHQDGLESLSYNSSKTLITFTHI